MDIHRTFLSLGYTGLLPFLLPVIFILSHPEESSFWLPLVQSYAFAIICFLTGSWWGFSFQLKSKPALIISNVLLLLAFVGFTLASHYWTVISAILLIAILVIEQYLDLFPELPDGYQRMRCILTSVAASCMLILYGIS